MNFNILSWMFIDFLGFSWISIDLHVFILICMDFYGFPWISFAFHGFERFWDQDVGRPLASCGSLCCPVAACAAGLDPLYINFRFLRPGSGGLVPGCLDAGRIGMDWNGLEIGDGGAWNGRRGLEGRPTRSSFRSSADIKLRRTTCLYGLSSSVYICCLFGAC